MVRLLVILLLVLIPGASFGQVQEEKLPGPRKPAIWFTEEQQNFDRARNIILNYREQCSKLASRTSPMILYSNVYCNNGDIENEAWIQYQLLDRRIHPNIEMNDMSYSERYFYMIDPVMYSAFTMKTEIGISIPELTTDRLSSRISTGLGYYPFDHQKYVGNHYWPISLSFFYHILK